MESSEVHAGTQNALTHKRRLSGGSFNNFAFDGVVPTVAAEASR